MALLIPPQPKAPRKLILEKAQERWELSGNTGPLPKVFNLACRSYRQSSMGNPQRNDFGIFDDAFFLVSPDRFLPQSANTDPSKIGWNPGVGKPYGILQPGVWWMYPGAHKGRKPALRQADDKEIGRKMGFPHDGAFEVLRCWGIGDPRNKLEWGWQQVNLHLAAITSTSSWLCLTVPYDREKWIQTVWDELKRHKQKYIPNILIEGPII